MNRKIMIMFLIVLISLTSFCKWIETTGEITGVEQIEEGYYGYSVTYDIDKIHAFYNFEGELIEGPITSMIFTDSPPIDNQKIKLKYDSEEPAFFEFIDDVKWQN